MTRENNLQLSFFLCQKILLQQLTYNFLFILLHWNVTLLPVNFLLEIRGIRLSPPPPPQNWTFLYLRATFSEEKAKAPRRQKALLSHSVPYPVTTCFVYIWSLNVNDFTPGLHPLDLVFLSRISTFSFRLARMSEQAVGQEADVLEISRWFIYAEDGRGSAWAKRGTVIGREQEYLSTSLLLFRIRQLPPSPPLWGPGGCDCMSEKSRAPAVLRNRRGTQAGCRANTEKNIFSLRQSRAEAWIGFICFVFFYFVFWSNLSLKRKRRRVH